MLAGNLAADLGSVDLGTQQFFVRTTGLPAALLVALAAAWPHILVAQSPDVGGPVQVGDLWIYETRNEVTGYPAQGYTEMVTQVSAKEILVNVTYREPVYQWPQSFILTYDRDWDTIDQYDWKFMPNNGLGIRTPLSVGKTWRAEFDAKNLTTTRASYRGTSSSKVTAQEQITTSAGTFDTFKVEQQMRLVNATEPAKLWEYQIKLWYAPQINHAVRQTILVKFEKRTRRSTSEELAEFSRKL